MRTLASPQMPLSSGASRNSDWRSQDSRRMAFQLSTSHQIQPAHSAPVRAATAWAAMPGLEADMTPQSHQPSNAPAIWDANKRKPRQPIRSEEHTSELQSPCNLV